MDGLHGSSCCTQSRSLIRTVPGSFRSLSLLDPPEEADEELKACSREGAKKEAARIAAVSSPLRRIMEALGATAETPN